MDCTKLDEMLEAVLESVWFSPGEGGGEPPLRCRVVRGSVPFLVVIGDNATGKSYFRRVLGSAARVHHKAEFIGLSMEARTGGSFMSMKSMVYGDEQTNATGANSVSTVITGITTARARTVEHVIFWDEPDIGLSDGYAMAAGTALADFAQSPGPKTLAGAVVTHRRCLLKRLAEADPYVVFMGDERAKSLKGWLRKPVREGRLEELRERSHATFLRLAAAEREFRKGQDK